MKINIQTLTCVILCTFFAYVGIYYRTHYVRSINSHLQLFQYIDKAHTTTPLHTAVVMFHPSSVKEILEDKFLKNPGTVHTEDGLGHQPLYYVSHYRPVSLDNLLGIGRPDIEIAKLLIEHGADVNANNGEAIDGAFNGWGNPEIIELLLQHGLNVANRNDLSKAAFRGHLKILKLLIAHGADVNKLDEEGKTPLDRASEALLDGQPVIDELKRHGAQSSTKSH